MPKIRFKDTVEFLDQDDRKDYTIIDMQQVPNGKLGAAVYEFARVANDPILYNRVVNEKVSLMVNGEFKHPDIWAFTYVNDLTEITVTPMLKGKGGGGIGIILGAIMMIVGYLIFPAAGAAATAGMFGTYTASIAAGLMISGAGMMLMGIAQMLFAPDLPSTPGAVEDSKNTKTYGWGGIRSMIRAGAPVPVLIGTHKIGGYIICLYTRPVGIENYLYVLFAISEGEIDGLCSLDYSTTCTTSDTTNSGYKDPAIFINDQPIHNYADVTWWFRRGYNLPDPGKNEYDCTAQNVIPNFNDVRVQYDDGRTIMPESGITYTTKSACDAVEVNVASPGLYTVDQTTGNIGPASIYYRMWYKLASEPTQWTDVLPMQSFAASMCKYFTRADGTAKSCFFGYSVSHVRCCNRPDLAGMTYTTDRPCYSGGVHKYANETFLNYYDGLNANITFTVNSSQWYKGRNRSPNVRIRLSSKTVYPPIAWAIDWLPGGTWEIMYKHSAYLNFEIYELGKKSYVGLYIEMKDEYETRLIEEYWDADGYWHAGGYEQVHFVRWPVSGWFLNIGSFNILLKSTIYDMPVWSESDANGKANGEINLFSLETTAGGVWSVVVSAGGERTPAYQWDIIKFPSNDIYDVRVARNVAKSISQYVFDDLVLDNIVEVIEESLIYPNTALLGLRIKANDQLSGSPPNITCVCRGVKVECPTMSGANFNDVFWDEASSRFENVSGSEVTWNGTSLSLQYTENPVAHLRNFYLNDRYGLGRHIKSYDLNYASWVEVIKDCHLSWNAHLSDYNWGAWWSTDSSGVWNTRILPQWTGFYTGSDGTTVDMSLYLNKEISSKYLYSDRYLGVGVEYPIFHFKFEEVFPSSLPLGNKVNIEITFSNYTAGVNLRATIFGYSISDDSLVNVTTKENLAIGSNKITFDCILPANINSFKLLFDICGDNGIQFEGRLTNVSLKNYDTHFDHMHEANGVAESPQSADSFLNEFCHSFRIWGIALNKQMYFKSNKDELPIHTVSESNLVVDSNRSAFEQNFTSISEIPYMLVAQFTDRNKNWDMDQRIAIVPLVEVNKSSKQDLGLKYVTDSEKVIRELKYQANILANCNHAIGFRISSEYLHAAAGDIINFSHSLPNWGTGQSGRVIGYSSGAKTITLDKPFTFTNIANKNFAILYASAPDVTQEIGISESGFTEGIILSTVTLTSWPANPMTDSSYIIGHVDESTKSFRLLTVVRDKDNYINCTGFIHEPSVYTNQAVVVVQEPISYIPENFKIEIVSFIVSQLTSGSGGRIGFTFSATGIVDAFYIEMSPFPSGAFTSIVSVDGASRSAMYEAASDYFIDGATYYFRIYASNSRFKSLYATSSLAYRSISIMLNPPTGLRLFGIPSSSIEWDTKNVTFIWNASSAPDCKYQLEIYNGLNVSIRTIELYDTSYTYLLSDNTSDNGGTPTATLKVKIATLSWDGKSISQYSPTLTFTNTVPSDITGIGCQATVGAVSFYWNAITSEDHKFYSIRTKVAADAWGNWTECPGNEYVRTLADAEIIAHTSRALVYIEVKAVDWYGQSSINVATTNGYANELSDSLFLLTASASAGVGTLSNLYDGNTGGGGWTIG